MKLLKILKFHFLTNLIVILLFNYNLNKKYLTPNHSCSISQFKIKSIMANIIISSFLKIAGIFTSKIELSTNPKIS